MPSPRSMLLLAPAVASLMVAQVEARAGEQPVTALFLSDIHFDPLADAGVAVKIARLPAAQWDAELARTKHDPIIPPDCGPPEPSTSVDLLQSTMRAASKANARFAVISGDLVVHQLQCRYAAMFPNDAPEAYSAFAAEAISYVLGKVRAATNNRPVYLALGNHDSGCGNYRRDPHDKLFARLAPAVAEAASPDVTAQAEIAKSFAVRGGYVIPSLPGLTNVGAVVIDTSPLSRRALDCSGLASDGEDTVRWAGQEIARRGATRSKSWLIGHIPPGIDVRATIQAERPNETISFLKSDGLAGMLTDQAVNIPLAIFGHTHMDEWRLFGDVPLKIVPAITPSSSNSPALMIAQVGTDGQILDYRIEVAPQDIRRRWQTEYSFRARYGVRAFNREALRDLTAERRRDLAGNLEHSAAYRAAYRAGSRPGSFLQEGPAWATYACATTSISQSQFLDCANWKPGD